MRRIGPVLIGTAARYDALAFNRVITARGALDADTLDDLLAHCRRLGVARVFLPLPPSEPEPDFEAVLVERGFVEHNRWVKLWRDASTPLRGIPNLPVESLEPRDRIAFAEVMNACFDFPKALCSLFGVTVGRERWHHFGIRHRGRLVAAAGLRLDRETAWFGPAGTVSEFRGRGAQKALLARRIEAARAAGCTLMCTETAEPQSGRPVPSLHNVRWAGFDIAYHRPNWMAVISDGPQGGAET